MFQRIALDPDSPVLTPADLKAVEQFADRIFSKIRLDITFTRHFPPSPWSTAISISPKLVGMEV